VLATHNAIDNPSGHSLYRDYMKTRVLKIARNGNPKESNEQWKHIRRGWHFGSEEFCLKIQDALHTAVEGKRRDSFMGEEIRLHDEQEAERLFQKGLACFGLQEEDLMTLKKGDDRKKVIAWNIRRKTSVNIEWIADRLQMGSRSNFASYTRKVERATDGSLWELKWKITN
jgi:hypothetical protein